MITKISEFAISLDKTTPSKTATNTYDRTFIEEQIVRITAQRDKLIALKEAELAECQSILDAMDSLQIKSRPIEIIDTALEVQDEVVTPIGKG